MNSLIFLGISYPIISICFRESNKNRKFAFLIALSFVIFLFVIKLYYDFQGVERNYYSMLEVGKRNSALEIRQSFKKVSLKLHPDKNPSVDAEEKFQRAKAAYDVLMDETKRDIYNRFGPEALDFDPRSDELKLIAGLGVIYIFWAVALYVATLSRGARACRTWVTLVLVGMLLGEVFFCLTETSLPLWAPATLTEYEFAVLLHAIFPGILVALRCLSEYLYVDVDMCSKRVLEEMAKHNKAMYGLLHQLQVLVTPEERSQSLAPLDEIKAKVAELRSMMKESNDSAAEVIALLKNANSNPGSNYYWLIFIFIYGGVYFFQ